LDPEGWISVDGQGKSDGEGEREERKERGRHGRRERVRIMTRCLTAGWKTTRR